MKKIHIASLLFVWLVALGTVEAQTVSPVDFMRMNPYQMKANPATDLPYWSVMSFFVGNVGIDLKNPNLHYDNLFEFDAQGHPATLNLRQFANSLKESNYLGLDANEDLFTLYKRLDYGMVTVNYGVKMQGEAMFNDGLFKLLGYGNGAFVGEDNPAEIDLDMNAQVYQELAVGFQRNVSEKLSLGGRVKMLFGLVDVATDAFNVKLYTDPDTYALRLEEDIAMKMAVPSVLYAEGGQLMTDGLFKAYNLFRNPGIGFDFAAEYRINDKFSAVAAVHDLGFIHWGQNNIEMKGYIHDAGQFYDDESFLFNGMDMDQLQLVIEDESYRELFLDTLQQYFQVDFNPVEGYNTMLNANLLLRGNFDVNPNNRLSAQMQGRFMDSGFRPAMTLAYSGSFLKMIDVCATYTMMKDSFDNVGLGLAFVFGTFHIYATTNNVIGLFKPDASAFNAQFGIVLNLRKDARPRM